MVNVKHSLKIISCKKIHVINVLEIEIFDFFKKCFESTCFILSKTQ